MLKYPRSTSSIDAAEPEFKTGLRIIAQLVKNPPEMQEALV